MKGNKNSFHHLFQFRICLCLMFLFFLSLSLPAQESGVENLLTQADMLYIQGTYDKALALYLEASRLTARNIYLSRAFFGVALCSFNLGDEAKTRKYLQQVFLVDPQKEISALFYPQSFLKIFAEVKKEYLAGEKKEVASHSGEVKIKEKTAETAIRPTDEKKAESLVSAKTTPKKETKEPVMASGKPRYFLGGYWEINVHYGRWGLEPASSLFEKNLKQRIGSEIRKELTDFLSSRYGSLVQSAYDQQLLLEVEGSNEGIGIRYFSRGDKGSFSLGFSLERMHLRLKSSGSISQAYDNGSRAEIGAEAFVKADPVCAHISFRWDFVPRSFLSPYFVFGLGFGPLNGKMGYSYRGIYSFYGYQESIKDSKEKTFEAWQQEEGSHISLKNIILFQLCFGLRFELYRGLGLFVETGLWDGFILQGGLAFRL